MCSHAGESVPCRYHGPTSRAVGTNTQPYIVLEDVPVGLSRPCVLDVKMGVQSWDEDAPAAKAMKEASKWPLQRVLGLRFTGMHVQWSDSARHWHSVKHGTDFAYSLTPATFVNALAAYAGHRSDSVDNQQAIAVLTAMMLQLEQLLVAMRAQHMYRAYGSSLLFVYDAVAAEPRLRMTMIDFGHVWPIREPAGVDAGYITGIESLLLLVTCALLDVMLLGSRGTQGT